MLVCGYKIEPKANLTEANLYGADLSRALLYGADLSRALLYGSNLTEANLYGANLSRALLYGANLTEANLYGANLSRANLTEANLYGADLTEANLYGADLTEANLYGANLTEANLYGANLSRANLYGANLSGAVGIELAIAKTRILSEGDLIGWKKCEDEVLVKLLIPSAAKRSHAFGRKCRSEFVEVLEVIGSDVGISRHDMKTEYRVGQRVCADNWCDDWREECAGGIHFFITRIEAENY